MNFVTRMRRSFARTGFAAALAIFALAACGENSSSSPVSTTYAFSTTTPEVAMDGNAVVDVRLVHKATGKPVTDAVIFETRFDMEPDGMSGMSAQATSMGSPMPGVYRFALKPTMAGRWALKLSAKVQGEVETVRGIVVVTAR